MGHHHSRENRRLRPSISETHPRQTSFKARSKSPLSLKRTDYHGWQEIHRCPPTEWLHGVAGKRPASHWPEPRLFSLQNTSALPIINSRATLSSTASARPASARNRSRASSTIVFRVARRRSSAARPGPSSRRRQRRPRARNCANTSSTITSRR